jgi:hypothetical protein
LAPDAFVGAVPPLILNVAAQLSPDYQKELGDTFANCGESPDLSEVGRWGEAVVFEHLKTTMGTASDITWVNELAESGLPYDCVIVSKSDPSDYAHVEVKCSFRAKDHFEISAAEIEHAQALKTRYHVYQVSLSNGSPTISIYVDPVDLIRRDALTCLLAKRNLTVTEDGPEPERQRDQMWGRADGKRTPGQENQG